ncbi:YHYH domain-containing protein [Phyllobacterium salinisoli]|uniref:YHYH domain-containing protein n=1 Tax=Phyllobacterium salinisoli TaxID=1899321 RepID=A0A368JZ54_9HYPH|nr:YHYH domain-containing protein [Phyllobacterium salinisoli]
MRKILLGVIFAIVAAGSAFAHSGGTDSNGCHTNHGGCHCH